jgi:hypothetical protein
MRGDATFANGAGGNPLSHPPHLGPMTGSVRLAGREVDAPRGLAAIQGGRTREDG